MRVRTGPRPGAIRAFAAIYLLLALLTFATGFYVLDETRSALAARMPGIEVSEDLAIVVLFTRLTIAAITLFLVWFMAARFARWLLGAMAIVNLWGIVAALPQIAEADIDYAATMGIRLAMLGAIGCLFLPGARRWFEKPEERDAAAFH